MNDRTRIVLILAGGLASLAALYVFQRTNYGLILVEAFGFTPNENFIFIINKTVRLLANDFVCVVMIFSVFKEKNYQQVTLAVFLIEFVVILPFYFLLKLNLEGSSELSSPLLSFIHRLIVNPTLMILTGMALAYQKFVFPTLRKK